MARIARGQENTPDNIAWFTRVLGVLTDMYAVQFRIFRIEDGVPGTQVFPASDWEDVSSGAGHFGVGSYYAYDNANAQGWTPDAGAATGAHRICWRWKQYDTSSWATNAEDFEVVGELPYPDDTYITIGDVREAGLTNPPYTDAMIEAAIRTWQEFLDRACCQWFLPRELELEFDGDNTSTAHFGVPIIEVEYLRINQSPDNLDPSLFKIYNEKKNPKIALVHTAQLTDIHIAPFSLGELRFYKGYKNQVVKGTFGCVDENGDPPALIKRALLKLVIEKLTRPVYGDVPSEGGSTTFAGVVIEEKTDGHSVKYGTASFAERRTGLSGITQDPEILDIIRLYKAPIGIAMPSHWSYY